MNIVQLSDIHFDPKYEPNGNAFCEDPICCRAGQNETNVSARLAGFWGDYNNCDTPWHSVIEAFSHVNNTHQVEIKNSNEKNKNLKICKQNSFF